MFSSMHSHNAFPMLNLARWIIHFEDHGSSCNTLTLPTPSMPGTLCTLPHHMHPRFSPLNKVSLLLTNSCHQIFSLGGCKASACPPCGFNPRFQLISLAHTACPAVLLDFLLTHGSNAEMKWANECLKHIGLRPQCVALSNTLKSQLCGAALRPCHHQVSLKIGTKWIQILWIWAFLQFFLFFSLPIFIQKALRRQLKYDTLTVSVCIRVDGGRYACHSEWCWEYRWVCEKSSSHTSHLSVMFFAFLPNFVRLPLPLFGCSGLQWNESDNILISGKSVPRGLLSFSPKKKKKVVYRSAAGVN